VPDPTVPEYRLIRRARPPVPAPVLDEAQREVVEHGDGPLLVLAGPGTGKTTTLVEAAVARVAAGVPVENLLMLTFSRRAAGELRDRVTARLDRTVREPVARTLHSYAFGVLRMAAVRQQLPAPRLLAGPEQDVLIRQLVAESPPDRWPAELRAALSTRAFAGELRDLLMRAVERGLDGPSLVALGERRRRADWVAAGEFLIEYQNVTVLKDPGGYDPAELIRSALNALTDDPELLAAERAARRRIFVDEYQDTDPAQAELLALLAAGADELILVGDPDQSIYAFRGADDSAMREAGARFGGTDGTIKTIALTTCRRSGPTLLAASRRVAAQLPGPVAQRALTPAPGLAPGSVSVGLFRSASEEAAYLAGVLRLAHLDGMPWSQMAVLVRSTTAVLGTLRRAMATAGVPVAVRGDDLPLGEQPTVGLLLDVVGCALDPEAMDEDAAERLLLGPIGAADVVYLRRLRRVLRQLGEPPADGALLAPALLDPLGARVLPEHVRYPVVRVAEVLAAGRAAVADPASSPEDVLWVIWSATGLEARWERASRVGGAAGAAADRDLDTVVALFDAAARFTDRLPAAPIQRFVEHLAAQQIPGDTMATRAAAPEAVSILTAHASKGLEWDLVCVANVQEGTWPDLRRRGSLLGSEQLVDILAGTDPTSLSSVAPQLAEERRLFYVAITRARRQIVATAVVGDEEQPSRFLDELDPVPDGERPITPPVRGAHLTGLVAELRAVVCNRDADADERQTAAVQLARLAQTGVPGAGPDHWWGLLPLSDDGPVADPARPVPVSPSRIESYLTCEVRAVLADFGVREGNQVAASLGTLVHEIAATAPPDADVTTLERMLDAKWASLDFGARWFADHERERARTIVAKLAEWLRTSRAALELVAVEKEFAVEIGDAQLRGRVDRLERDRAGRLVVIDLKTGKTKLPDADMPMHPQLGAYQLAVEHGAFPDDGEHSGGAMLVQLASGAKVAEQKQPPLAEAADPTWISDEVARVAARLRGSEFTSTINSKCRMCDVKASCPLQPEGRQVTA
jgi:superfamily I DNA/RNA helicase/RecB family exonuclease